MKSTFFFLTHLAVPHFHGPQVGVVCSKVALSRGVVLTPTWRAGRRPKIKDPPPFSQTTDSFVGQFTLT